jgi:hypothetical protein
MLRSRLLVNAFCVGRCIWSLGARLEREQATVKDESAVMPIAAGMYVKSPTRCAYDTRGGAIAPCLRIQLTVLGRKSWREVVLRAECRSETLSLLL